jgi:thiol-disulfide isomerase/thioredoxin
VVSKDAVLAVFVVSVALALGVSFYREIYAAYLEPPHGNVSPLPLNDTRRREVLGGGYVLVTYYYRSDCPVCREQTPILEELATSLNDTVFLEKVNVRAYPDQNVSGVPTIRIEGARGRAELAGLSGAGRVMREVIRVMGVREDAARPP